MAGQENCVRVTRLALKRAAAGMGESESSKKRVVLGEICSNSGYRASKHECGMMMKAAKKVVVDDDDDDDEDEDDDEGLEVPQILCDDIFEYLREMEIKTRPLPDYIDKDMSMNKMRGILVDLLVKASVEYKLIEDTLYLTVSYIDKYLSINNNIVDLNNNNNKHKLHLLGVASMLIASKYEEITPPDVDEFCHITHDNTYTKEEVVNMEADVLKSLKYQMGNPTVKTFLTMFNRVSQENENELELTTLGNYLAELSLLDYGCCVKLLPSLVAASVTYLSRFTLKPTVHPWTSALQQYTGYKSADLKECVLIIQDLQLSKRAGELMAVRDKYQQLKFKSVSSLSSPQIPLSFFQDA